MASYKILMKTLVSNLAVSSDPISDQDIDNVLALEKEFVSVKKDASPLVVYDFFFLN